MDINEGKMMIVEVVLKGRWFVKEIGVEFFFYVNMYVYFYVN